MEVVSVLPFTFCFPLVPFTGKIISLLWSKENKKEGDAFSFILEQVSPIAAQALQENADLELLCYFFRRLVLIEL